MEMVDLTIPLNNQAPCPVGHPLFISQIKNIKRKDRSNSTLVLMTTHVSTHIDTPYHVLEDGKKLDQIPLEDLVREGVVLNFPRGDLGEITSQDLENANPKILKGDIVFINTGWYERHKERIAPLRAKQPGITQEAAEWLVERGVKVVGIDALVIQNPNYDGLTVHKTLLDANSECVGIVECLANLQKVANRRLKLGIFPLPVTGSDGAPVRVVAFLGF